MEKHHLGFQNMIKPERRDFQLFQREVLFNDPKFSVWISQQAEVSGKKREKGRDKKGLAVEIYQVRLDSSIVDWGEDPHIHNY